MSCEVRFDPTAACDRCGQFGAFLFDGQTLCGDCYETRGSCCPEFGRDDLWREETTTSPATTSPETAPDKVQKRCPPDRGSAR
jgi:hypothetical protein